MTSWGWMHLSYLGFPVEFQHLYLFHGFMIGNCQNQNQRFWYFFRCSKFCCQQKCLKINTYICIKNTSLDSLHNKLLNKIQNICIVAGLAITNQPMSFNIKNIFVHWCIDLCVSLEYIEDPRNGPKITIYTYCVFHMHEHTKRFSFIVDIFLRSMMCSFCII